MGHIRAIQPVTSFAEARSSYPGPWWPDIHFLPDIQSLDQPDTQVSSITRYPDLGDIR